MSFEKGDIQLPKALNKLLSQPAVHAIPRELHPTHLAVADTGATDHMVPDKSAFISYTRVTNLRVCMGNKSYAPVLGKGTTIISLNGHSVLIRDVLHVPSLRNPLYSLRAHQRQRGCGFVGASDMGGIYVYFPTFLLEVDTSSDCHLGYSPLGVTVSLQDLHYVQPRCAHKSPPAPQAAASTSDDDWRNVSYSHQNPKGGSTIPPSLSSNSVVPSLLVRTIVLFTIFLFLL